MGALSISELESLKRFSEDLLDPVYIVDRDYRLIHVNPAYRRMFRFRDRPDKRCSDHLKMDICSDACVLKECMENKSRAMFREAVSGASRTGDLTVQVGSNALLDEAGEVAGAITFLRDVSVEVQVHHKYKAQLERERRANEILEQTVQERTRELRTTNKEVRSILDNIGQAIFTVNQELKINAEYSKHVERVFEGVEIAGARFAELLHPRDADADPRSKLEDWAKLAFAQPHLPWEIVGDLVTKEITYRRSADQMERILVLEYVPIREDGGVAAIMVLVEDVTEKRRLESEVARQKKENEDNVAQIAEIIHLDPEIFDQFLAEAAQLIGRAREESGAMAEMSSADRKKAIDGLFRQIHTLKGNAKSFKLNLIAERAHHIEDLFAQIRDGSFEFDDETYRDTKARLGELEELLDRAGRLRDQVLKREPDLGKTREDKREPVVKIGSSKLTELREYCATLEARNEPLTDEQFRSMVQKVRGLTHVPFGKLLTRLRRMVPDIAKALDKRVNELGIAGAEGFDLDVEVLTALGDPLIHIIRNAVDHGVETPSERQGKGKPEAATVGLKILLDDPEWVRVEVSDDGKGIDPARIREKAVSKGLLGVDDAERASREELMSLIFEPGFSTAQAVTDISGRGVGMDAVKAALTALGGSVEVRSEVDRGSTFVLKVPASVIRNGMPAPAGEA